MNGRRMIAVRNEVVLVLLLIVTVTPARAESVVERMSRLQTELEWVAGELRTIDNHGDSESRERLDEEVERLEQERLKLLRVMPDHIDSAELLEQLTRLAAKGLELHASEPKTIDHGDYETVTIRVELEGTGDETQRFVRRVRLSQGVKRVTEIEGDETAHVVDVTAFMIPQKNVELRSCSIPESSPDASERESMLRERLISRCAALGATDLKLRTAIHRRHQLQDWINLTARLAHENPHLEPEEDVSQSVAEFEAIFADPEARARLEALLADPEPSLDEEAPADIAEILADPDPALDEVFADLAAIKGDPEPSVDEEAPANTKAILAARKPPLEERMKQADAMADMRWISTAAEAYAVDHDRYPETSDIAQLSDTLADYVSDAVGTLAQTDPWGRPYRWISDGHNYRIVSGGRDGTIEETSLEIYDDIHQNDDVVFQNPFRQAPPR